MAAIGQSRKVLIETVAGEQRSQCAQDTEVEGAFTLTRVTRLNKESSPCSEDSSPSSSLTSCLQVEWRGPPAQGYLALTVGCTLHLLAPGGEACYTRERLNHLYQLYIWLKRAPWQEVAAG